MATSPVNDRARPTSPPRCPCRGARLLPEGTKQPGSGRSNTVPDPTRRPNTQTATTQPGGGELSPLSCPAGVSRSVPAAPRGAMEPSPPRDGFIFPLQPPAPRSLPGGGEVRAAPAGGTTAALLPPRRCEPPEQSHGSFFEIKTKTFLSKTGKNSRVLCCSRAWSANRGPR